MTYSNPLASFSTAFIEKVETALGLSGFDYSLPIVVAFSGGPDSTAALLALACISRKTTGFTLIAAHFNHRMRGDESYRDVLHVRSVCDNLGLPLIEGSGDVPSAARVARLSLEEAARLMRYRFLANSVESSSAQGVITGHTRDDQSETVLMNALRGTGVRGLSGMRHRKTLRLEKSPPLEVMRPMLGIKHTECEAACESVGVPFLTDASNFDGRFERNRIRHELLPLAEDIRPGASAAIARIAETASSALESIEYALAIAGPVVQPYYGASSVEREALRKMPDALRVFALMRIWEHATSVFTGIEFLHIKKMSEIVASAKNTRIDLPGGYAFIASNKRVYITDKDWREPVVPQCPCPDAIPDMPFSIGEVVELPGGFTIGSALEPPPKDPHSSSSAVAHLDASACSPPMKIRARSPGDLFTPLGMKTPVRIQDFFVGAHVPAAMRDRVPLVEFSRGIGWVAGWRIADWAKMNSGTQDVLHFEFRGPDGVLVGQ